jgi:NADH-quinone oxidoreductase subunit J
MDARTALFYVFASVLLFAAFRVITARNPVHAALFLVLAFFQAAAVWLLLKAEFLAITLVLVYVGAVMVLFLFVVMMLDVNLDSMRQGFWKHFPLAGAVGAIIALEMSYVLMGGFREPPKLQSYCTQNTSIHWKLRRLFCLWPSSPLLRSPCASARTASTPMRPTRFGSDQVIG